MSERGGVCMRLLSSSSSSLLASRPCDSPSLEPSLTCDPLAAATGFALHSLDWILVFSFGVGWKIVSVGRKKPKYYIDLRVVCV